MRWPGRSTVPDDVRRAAGLGARERVLASATTVDGDTVLATGERLLLVAPGSLHWARPWSRVDSAGWDDEAGVLRVEWLEEAVTSLALAGDIGRRLPEVVRERVESSVVVSRRVEVRGAGGVRLVVRRAGDGLALQTVPDPGTRLDDPAVVVAVDEARRELTDEVGAMPPERA